MPGQADIIRDSVVEFSRLQDWMLSAKEHGDMDTYNMSLIKTAIVAADKNMDTCKKIIEKYNQEENKDLLQFILNS